MSDRQHDAEQSDARQIESERRCAHESKILGTPSASVGGVVNLNDPTQAAAFIASGGFGKKDDK